MSKLGELYVEISADTTKFDKGVDSAKKGTDKFEGSLTTMSGTVKKLLGAGALIALASKIKDVATESINAASDAEETQNKFNVVFSGISEYANEMAESLAESYGTSTQGAKDMLAGTGDLLTGLGFTQESAFNLSEQVLTLGADLASFTNYSGGAEGASEALTKALLGEREMLKGLGISINEADLKAELLAQSQAGVTFETEKQAKAQATLNLVMMQTLNAQGDFANSRESFANQLKIAKASTADLSVEIGRSLLPAAKGAVGVFGSLTGKLGDYLKSLNDIKNAELAQEAGVATAEQKLTLLKNTLDFTEKELKAQQAIVDADNKYRKEVDPLAQRQLDLLQRKVAGIYRNIDAIEGEAIAEQRLAEKKKETEEKEQELKETQEAKARAIAMQQAEQLEGLNTILNTEKTEIDLIDDQIAAIENFTNLDAEAKAKQKEALELLQAEKLALIEEEEQAKIDSRVRNARAEENANEQSIREAERVKEEKIALKQAEADFTFNVLENLQSLQEAFNDSEISAIEVAKDKKIAALDEELLGTEEYNKQVLAIEKAAANKVYEIEKQQFYANQALALSQIAIETAIGVAKVYGQTGIFGLAAQVPVIAMGVAQAAVVASQQPPQKPQLATGAIVAGSQRGVDVTVGEAGNDELILGGGSRGEEILGRFADKIASRMGTGQTVINNFNGRSLLSRSELDDFARKLYPSQVNEQQRRGVM